MRGGIAWALVALTVLLALSPSGIAEHVDLSELFQILPWDSLHTITNPQFNDRPYVSAYEEVVGVTIGNESHTYPIKLMNYHEVINDIVGGVPVVVAWCPLCGVAIVYERTVDGEVVTFRTSGYLYRNNKVLFDVQTGSLWPMILGEAINGTYHGTRLKLVSSIRIPFGEWIALYPGAKVVARPWGPVLCPFPCPVPPGFEGYDVNPYADYNAANWTYAPIQNPDARLHPKTYVVGIARNGDAWALAYPDLLEEEVVHETVGGTRVVVAISIDLVYDYFVTASAHAYLTEGRTFSLDNETDELVDDVGARYDVSTGNGTGGRLEPVDSFYGFWFAWHDLYPETRLFGYERLEDAGPSRSGMILIGGIGIASAAAASVAWWWRRRRKARSA